MFYKLECLRYALNVSQIPLYNDSYVILLEKSFLLL